MKQVLVVGSGNVGKTAIFTKQEYQFSSDLEEVIKERGITISKEIMKAEIELGILTQNYFSEYKSGKEKRRELRKSLWKVKLKVKKLC